MNSNKLKKKLWIHLGPGKSGSTWIYNIAKNNSSIFNLPKIKETQSFHFSNHFNKDFYDKKYFLNNKNNKIFCDFSNTYFFNPISIANVKNLDKSDFKVFSTVLLRCPFKRTISHFKYLLASGKIPKISLRELMAEDPSILWRSRYDIHLEYMKKVNLDFQAYVLEEQNIENPQIYNDVLKIFDFKNINLNIKNVDRFEAMVSRNHLMSQSAKSIATFLRRKKYFFLLENLKNNQIIRSIFMKKSLINPEISEDDIKYLKLYFEPVIEYCSNMDLRIDNWLK